MEELEVIIEKGFEDNKCGGNKIGKRGGLVR